MTESNELTRPIIGIENRSAQEVFDIMCDRIRQALALRTPSDGVSDEMVERFKAEFAHGRGLMMPSTEFVRRCMTAALSPGKE